MDSDSNEYSDSDEELQQAHKDGYLKPGLNFATTAPRKFCNDEVGLQSKLEEFKNQLEWYERLDITTDIHGQNDDTNYEDDFQRELKFYQQAQAAVMKSLPRLEKLGIPTKRPPDYFAEMVKTDDHMQKVRQKILTKKTSLEKSEKAKKLRELKKYGKKVQHEVLQKRQKEKKQMIEAVKKYRKGQKNELDFLGNDEDGKTKSSISKAKGPGQKRQFKNDKFGFGGRKKGQKQNTQDSFRQVDNVKPRKFNTGGINRKLNSGAMKGKKGGKKGRPGKKRRQQTKSKRK